MEIGDNLASVLMTILVVAGFTLWKWLDYRAVCDHSELLKIREELRALNNKDRAI